MNFLTTPAPHTEGAAFIRNKPAVTRAVFDALAPDLQARALVITGVESLDAVARVREHIATLPIGGDYEEIKAGIFAELSPWLVTSTDPEERAKQLAAARRRSEMLLRMHGWQAYARTQHALMEAHVDVFPYRQYLSSEDGRVRPSHAALNKKILPADHPFWLNHTPPWEFGCRCDCVPMSQEEVDELRDAESWKLEENREVLGTPQLREIEDNGRLAKPNGTGFLDIRTPRERNGSGYEWRPAEDALQIDQILDRYTPLERQAFESFAKNQTLEDGRTLFQWWKTGATPATATAPAAPSIVPAIARPITPAIPAPLPGPAPAATRPVSAALTHAPRTPKANQATTTAMLKLIDATHGDGTLLPMPVRWGAGTSGHYAAGREIKVGKSGLSLSQIVHEIGHKLDREGIPSKASPYASLDSASEIADVLTAIRASAAVLNLHNAPLYLADRKYRAYQLSAKELWARAYAQYIAEESRDKGLLAEIAARRSGNSGYWPDSQWETADFAPIRLAIKAAFLRLGWLPAPTKTTTP